MEYDAWQELEDLVEKKDYWDMLMPSHFARSIPGTGTTGAEIGANEQKRTKPAGFLLDITAGGASQFQLRKEKHGGKFSD